MRNEAIIVWLLVGLCGAALFENGVLLPIWGSVLGFVLVSLYLAELFRRKILGVVTLLYWGVFALPFIHLVPYLWFNWSGAAPVTMWGLTTVPYMLDREIIELTGMIGVMGGVGFALAISFIRTPRTIGGPQRGMGQLSIPVWLSWAVVGVVLSSIAAPDETLFGAAYTTSMSSAEVLNFGSAWMISYIVLAFCACDALKESSAARKRFKQRVLAIFIIFVTLFLQLLRGDRAIVPFLFALVVLHFYWGNPRIISSRSFKIPVRSIAITVFALVGVSMVVGAIRSALVGVHDITGLARLLDALTNDNEIGLGSMLNGTWSAVLLTPLSVAGDYLTGRLHWKYGQTYLDLLLSTPPGFIADALGYTRPIGVGAGPAFEMRYGLGGTHASVVPFMNFGIWGALLVPAAWAYLVTRIERAVLGKLNAQNLALLLTMALVAPHFLWYGEKYAISGAIIWWGLAIAYRISRRQRTGSVGMLPRT